MKYICLLALFISAQSAFAQANLPIIKASSKSVAIRDGEYFDKNAWNLSPKARPDVFTADRTRESKWVTFYTDIDSIRVKVKPGTRFNFIILLNGKDSCYTQIASAIPPPVKAGAEVETHDTIPFTLTSYNAISVKAVINNTDTILMAFDASSFDFHLIKDAILKRTKLLSNQPDALAGKVPPNYNRLNKIFKLQLAGMVWNNPDVSVKELASEGMDGSFGANLFDGKIIELNYDKNLLVVHSKLPGDLKGYKKSKLNFKRSFMYAKGTIEAEGKNYTGNFLFDNGSALALIIDSGWAAHQNFPKDLKLIKSSTIRDPRGVKYETRVVLAPALTVNGFTQHNIPTLMLSNKNPARFEINYFGNDFLKRFNIVFDLKNDCVYLKPNQLAGLPYRSNS
jgi:hypothetical protein